MNGDTFALLISAANTLTWPGAFAIVGCAASAAVVAVAVVWALRK
jgi:hypothetical protein